MKLYLILIISIFAFNISAKLRVMTFNTTCSLCAKKKFDKFKKRKHWIVDTIKRNNPDIIALQEVLTTRQLKWIKKKLKNYDLFYAKFRFFRFADPGIFIKKNRLKVHKKGGFWLGPRGHKRFTLGWKKGIPRRSQYMVLTDKMTKKKFVFTSAHFDNDSKNRKNSIAMTNKFYEKFNLPIVFAADTNTKPIDSKYEQILDLYQDSYDLTQKHSFITNTDSENKDSCNLEKGKTFPDCRVDHVLLSRHDKWKVSNWGLDQFRYGKDSKFTSDHRALFADIELE